MDEDLDRLRSVDPYTHASRTHLERQDSGEVMEDVGVRVWLNFVTAEQERELVREAKEAQAPTIRTRHLAL
ncbi:MAG: hypothetical protein CMQ29_03760 [Gammaproteobacteria bacterium]|nr:hypothetical protein [Gammaproteobacteria bacterium]